MVNLVNTSKLYKQESSICKIENNDCVVRAFAAAFNLEYDVAHSYVEQKFNRKPKKGTLMVVTIMDQMKNELGHKVEALGQKWDESLGIKWFNGKRIFNGRSKRRNCVRGYTTGSFLKDYPKGTYIMIISRHAFTIIDGVVFGNSSDAKQLKSRIENVYKITKL